MPGEGRRIPNQLERFHAWCNQSGTLLVLVALVGSSFVEDESTRLFLSYIGTLGMVLYIAPFASTLNDKLNAPAPPTPRFT